MADLTTILGRALTASWLRHQALATNVANAETPGYKRVDLDFRRYVEAAMKPGLKMLTTSSRHLTGSSEERAVMVRDLSSVSPDGNGVDIDKEMAEVASNSLYYSAVARQLSSHLSLLRRAITEGRR